MAHVACLWRQRLRLGGRVAVGGEVAPAPNSRLRGGRRGDPAPRGPPRLLLLLLLLLLGVVLGVVLLPVVGRLRRAGRGDVPAVATAPGPGGGRGGHVDATAGT